jgi:hypothetical protein
VPPTSVADVLKKKLPESSSIMRFASRVKGGGSLGRPRYIAIAHWPGGRIVREAKALVPQVPSLGVDGRVVAAAVPFGAK